MNFFYILIRNTDTYNLIPNTSNNTKLKEAYEAYTSKVEANKTFGKHPDFFLLQEIKSFYYMYLFRAVRILNGGFNDKKIFIALLIKEFLNSK
jgi:hypothetical protein